MTKEEHLNSGDVIFAFISFFLVTATLVVIAWNFYTYQALYRNGRENQLHELANQIENSLKKETNAAIYQLKSVNESFINDSTYNNKKIRGYYARNSNKFFSPYDVLSARKFFAYPRTQHITWIDSSGMQRIRWSVLSYTSKKLFVEPRPYFQNAIHGNLWEGDSAASFFLEPVKSWLSKETYAIVSMQSKLEKPFLNKQTDTIENVRLPVMVISSRFQSVFDPILPPGFAFAVLNEEGRVYFHSNHEIDLNEDFLKETGNHYVLSSAIKSRMDEDFNAYYYGKQCRFYVKPVRNMPLYIVTFSEMNRLSANNTALLSAVSVFIFLQALLIIISALLIQMFRVRSTRSLTKSYSLSWLTPKMEHRAAYNEHVWLYLLMMLTEILFARPFHLWFNGEINNSFFTPGVVYTYSMLAVGFSYYIIRIRSGKETTKNNTPAWYLLSGVGTLYIFLVILFIINFARHGNFLAPNFILVQALPFIYLFNIKKIAAAGNLIIGLLKRFVKFIFGSTFYSSAKAGSRPIPYNRSYKAAIFMFIMLTSVVSSSIIYRQCYNQETILMLKNKQLQLVQSIWNKNDTTKIAGDSMIGRYYNNIIANNVTPSTGTDKSKSPVRGDFSSMYRAIRPSLKDIARNHVVLTPSQNNDTTFQWTPGKNSLTLDASTNNLLAAKKGISNLKVSSSLHKLGLPGFNYFPGTGSKEGSLRFVFVFYLFFMLVLLPGIWLLIKLFVKRVLIRSLPPDETEDPEFLKRFLYDPQSKHLLVVGIPDSGKVRYVQKLLQDYKPGKEMNGNKKTKMAFENIDMTAPNAIPDKLTALTKEFPKPAANENPKVKFFILVKNFEYCFLDNGVTEKKLACLEQLLRQDHWNIILFSTTQTFPFIEKYFEIIHGKTNANEKEIQEATLAAERWMNVLNNFPVYYYRWHRSEEALKTQTVENTFTEKECFNSDFLSRLQPQLATSFEKLKTRTNAQNAEDETEIKISQLAGFYFDSIWMSLTKSERKVLYDLAKDGLVNDQYVHELTILKQKGLLTYANQDLQIMSSSFRNYILTQLNKEEINRIKADTEGKGTWGNFRNIVVIVIIIVGVFLFITQEEMLNNLVAYLTAFSGGIFALINIIDKIPASSK